ncbi:hypothetical protein Q5P01_001958 [Channa striata]|uniref:Immunoglobulin V-set domain-containing protein n=1 Tax=Channa striata TaxID=64152 RepID=A0AA88NQ72_CHASR|nr:hypothetical protein Q5P01_001958 [Channa striata]
MILLPLGLTLWTVSLWTAGSSQILLTEPTTVLYPKLGGSETIECGCGNITCDSVFWFFSNPSRGTVEFLGRCNNAERANYGKHFEHTRFKMTKRGTTSFMLRIINVTVADTGIYSCVVKEKGITDMWKPGYLLLPGVTPPTLPPVTKRKPPVKPICTCKKSHSGVAPGGCDSYVLWPIVGIVAGLALALICSLYYFSRLPKKCHHHFAKKGQR